ncbi:hypothetical protein AALB52_04335 [Lachnospiraceae bacterium 38-14]|uniref:hypothetical protein n=1 Tax=Roseburia sp. 1XD42-69 TaxID=2320088 RepID=UPI000EA3572F|nr:hypothetical protein [Roseburia sp. 1XD42-69]RKJ68718.1 hypothetical protein D7Y06_00245 [Roseburia sp. 1XD42-69]
MYLEKINSNDLIFSDNIEDDRTNTYLHLYDYDWMDYNLSTRFKTESLGILNVKFSYFGMTTSTMEVEQNLGGNIEKITYEYSTDIFKKYIVKFLKKHISFWGNKYAFNGEEEVIEFFNDVIENGKVVNR